jgi:hypothetical protein
MYGINSEDLTLLDNYYLLTSEQIIRKDKRDAIFPNIVTNFVNSYVENFIKANRLLYNNTHHIRIIDGYEREEEALKIANLVLPNLQDSDLVLSNSTTIKKVINENSKKKLVQFIGPTEDLLSNHYMYVPHNVPKDIRFSKTVSAYLEMILLSRGNHFHKYTIYDNNHWSAFLIHTAINQPNYTEYQIPRDLIEGIWNNGHLEDEQWLLDKNKEIERRFN